MSKRVNSLLPGFFSWVVAQLASTASPEMLLPHEMSGWLCGLTQFQSAVFLRPLENDSRISYSRTTQTILFSSMPHCYTAEQDGRAEGEEPLFTSTEKVRDLEPGHLGGAREGSKTCSGSQGSCEPAEPPAGEVAFPSQVLKRIMFKKNFGCIEGCLSMEFQDRKLANTDPRGLIQGGSDS